VAADGDPDAAEIAAIHERRQADGYREALELLSTKAELRHRLTLERVIDLLLLFVGWTPITPSWMAAVGPTTNGLIGLPLPCPNRSSSARASIV
jgi:hypothetical protein